MNFIYVLNGKRIKKILIVAVLALFAIGITYNEANHISVFAVKGLPSAVYSVPTEKKIIALTFDISWGETRTEPILKVLQDKGIKKATFFLSSPWSKSHPEIVNNIVKGGFEIGSHGHKHVNYSTLNDEEIRKQIVTSRDILKEVTGKDTNIIRMPNGDFDKRVLKIASELNYTVIQWDTDSLDWKNPGTDKIVQRVVTKAHPGDIVLLHASDSCKQTHEALPVIIDQLRAKGYEFVTVSEMLNQSDVKNNAVKDQE